MEPVNDIIKTKRGRKKGDCKYSGGYLQHFKEIGYNKSYYQEHKLHIRCNLCTIPVLARCLARHQTTSRCLKFRICLDPAASE